jgi:phosphatidylinositol alpha 1,6-mannosyltransferase
VVVATPGPMGLAGWLTARLLGVRLTVLHQVDLAGWLRRTGGNDLLAQLAQTWLHLLWRGAHAVLVPDSRSAAAVAAAGVPGERVRLLPRAVDRGRFNPDRCRPAFWRRRGLGAGCKVLYAGPLTTGAPVETLLAAFTRLLTEQRAAQLVLVGDGPAIGELSRRFHHPAILFAGRLAGDELAHAFASADLYVDLESGDLRGQRLVTALASGVPALVDDAAAAADLVRASGAGMAVATTDAAALLDALRLLVVDVPRRTAAARAAREVGRTLPNWYDALDPLLAESWPPASAPPAPADRAPLPAPGATRRRASA